MIASDGPKGTDHASGFNAETFHLSDWLEAIREGRDPLDTVEAGVQAAAVCHYGNISYKEKRFVQI